MARILKLALAAVPWLVAAALVVTGVVMVASHGMGPVYAGLLGGAALLVVELGVAVSQRVRVKARGAGTQRARVLALAAVEVLTLLVAAVAVRSGRPTADGVLAGAAAVVVLLTVVGIQVGRARAGATNS